MLKKPELAAIAVTVVLLIPVLALFSEDLFGGDDEEKAQAPEASDLLGYSVASNDLSATAFSLEEIQGNQHLVPTLTPLMVRHHVLEGNPGEAEYNPLFLGSSKIAERHRQLSSRDVVDVADMDPAALLGLGWEESELVILVSSYPGALKAAPLASYLSVPLFFREEAPSAALKTAGCRAALLIGEETASMGGVKNYRVTMEEVDSLYLDVLQENGDESDYMVVTNPDDIWKYESDPNYLPVPDLSMGAAQLAAYRKAPVLFSEGLDNWGLEFGDGFTQLGVPREANNAKADITLGLVKDMAAIYENRGMELGYLALVGGPVALPMFSWDINDYQADRQYTPSDYYFGDLNDDPYQELAVGRIMGRDVSDAFGLIINSLGYEEIKDYAYPKDDSSTVYDSVSENWQENSMAMVGTTKIGPFPGILTPTLANQTYTMTEGGYHVTSCGYDLATQAEMVKEIIDEMNYAVYYGHGDVDCWYSSVPDPVDSDMLNAQDLKPGFAIAMACLTGMTDSLDITLDQYISLAFVHSGYAGYIGATRVAYGLYDYEIREDGAMRGTGALYLVDRFTEKICEEDMDVGEALRQSKNALIDVQGWDRDTADGEESQITVTQYVLYGDPAHDLHVPALD